MYRLFDVLRLICYSRKRDWLKLIILSLILISWELEILQPVGISNILNLHFLLTLEFSGLIIKPNRWCDLYSCMYMYLLKFRHLVCRMFYFWLLNFTRLLALVIVVQIAWDIKRWLYILGRFMHGSWQRSATSLFYRHWKEIKISKVEGIVNWNFQDIRTLSVTYVNVYFN